MRRLLALMLPLAALPACSSTATHGTDAAATVADARPDGTCRPCPPDAANDAANDAAPPVQDAAPPVHDGAGPAADAAVPPPADANVPGPDAAAPSDAAAPPGPDAACSNVPCPDVDAAEPSPDAAPPPPVDAAVGPPPDAARPAWVSHRLFGDADGVGAPDGLHRMADGRVLVVNQVSMNVQVVDPLGPGQDTIAVFAEHFDGLSKPEESADGPDGVVYVSDNVSRNVFRIAPDGTHTVFAGRAQGLVEPKGIAVRPDGTVVVADEAGQQIVSFAPGSPADGTPPTVLLDVARGAHSPESLSLGNDGSLYVTDDHHGGVLRIAPDGTVSEFLTPAQLRYADGVGVAPDGDLWFTDMHPRLGRRVLHFTPAARLVEILDIPGPGAINGVAVLNDGRVLTSFYLPPYLASEIWVSEPPAP